MKKSIYILGINFAYHELAACLLKNGELIGAIEEERFSRIKRGKPALVSNPNVLPKQAIRYCLALEKIRLADVDHIAFSFFPKNRLKNINIDPYFTEGDWGSKKGEELFYKKIMEVPDLLEKEFKVKLGGKVQWIPHHISHAASSYFISPFEEAAILSIDGIGEIASTWMGYGSKNHIEKIKEISYPNSMGFVWEKLSKFLGFSEYDSAKVMGLSAYGHQQRYFSQFKKLITLQPEGEFRVDNSIFKFRIDDFKELERIFGVKKINSPAERTSTHEDIAAGLQQITTEVLLHIAQYLSTVTKSRHLCLAGGVALNCVSNAAIMNSGNFDEIYVQPAANDAGTALGAAYYLWHQNLNQTKRFVMDHAYWGSEFTDSEIQKSLKQAGLSYQRYNNIAVVVAQKLSENSIVGWFQGRSELGPRALGNRSLLADPRNPAMKRILNERIKKREPFRPFAPSILQEDASKWFFTPSSCSSLSTQFMEINFDARPDKKDQIPGVVHVDGTSRVQLVNKKTNPNYYKLISAFKKLTGVPIVLNTSFNDNEPIVNSPQDAINTFLRTRMDYLALNNFLVKNID